MQMCQKTIRDSIRQFNRVVNVYNLSLRLPVDVNRFI